MPLRRLLLLSAAGLALLGGATLVGRTSGATAASACPTDVAATFTNLTRPIVPIGATASRLFEIKGQSITGVQLSVPAEYSAAQSTTSDGVRLRFKAPHAGAFTVQAAWTQMYYNGTDTVSCSASAGSTLTAARGTPLVVRHPPAGRERGLTTYDNPAVWTWKCRADSNPTPLTLKLRWEVDKRPIPMGVSHGPYKFSRRAKKAYSAIVGDPCDFRQPANLVLKLPKSAKVGASAGLFDAGPATLTVSFKSPQPGGIFRNPKGNAAPLHLGVELIQGSRTLVSAKLCAWYNSGFVVAKGKDVGCWW